MYANKRFLLFAVLFLLSLPHVSSTLSWTVGTNVKFYTTNTDYFVFNTPINVDSVVWTNNGWQFTNIHQTGDDEDLTLDKVWISLTNAQMTINHLYAQRRFEATLTAPTGTISTLKLQISIHKVAPKIVKVNNIIYKTMCPSMTEFNKAQYTTWHWQSGTLYIKIKHESPAELVIDWTPPSTEEPTTTVTAPSKQKQEPLQLQLPEIFTIPLIQEFFQKYASFISILSFLTFITLYFICKQCLCRQTVNLPLGTLWLITGSFGLLLSVQLSDWTLFLFSLLILSVGTIFLTIRKLLTAKGTCKI